MRLWDLRQTGSVRTFTGHVNRTMRIGAAISPCLRYIATGSEDRCVYVYDLPGPGQVVRSSVGYREVDGNYLTQWRMVLPLCLVHSVSNLHADSNL